MKFFSDLDHEQKFILASEIIHEVVDRDDDNEAKVHTKMERKSDPKQNAFCHRSHSFVSINDQEKVQPVID